MKKPAALSAGLVAVKGTAAPVQDMPTRSVTVEPPKVADTESGLQPLNFKVSAKLRREFKTYAAAHDMKLIELLQAAFDSYRAQRGD
jgi:hypothetical protein